MLGSPPLRGITAYYASPVERFLSSDPATVLGLLVAADGGNAIDATQRQAWQEEIEILRGTLSGLSGIVYLEFAVPRLGSRIDAVLVTGPAVFPIEFKCGEKRFTTDAYNQTWDYGLDLKNFHLASHAAAVFPILIPTAAASGSDPAWHPAHADGLRPPRRVLVTDLRSAVDEGLAAADGPPVDGDAWGRSAYQPTPTIIEAARALYARHSVDAITRNDAGAKNLQQTSAAVEEIIEQARRHSEKAILFVTGVPGAGKTLVGLNVATERREMGEARAVFLSGNQPLVSVLQEALTRDEYERTGRTERKGARSFVSALAHIRVVELVWLRIRRRGRD